MNQTVRWEPDRTPKSSGPVLPGFFKAIRRGVMDRCPACGRGKVFAGYLRVNDDCAVCGTKLGRVRADDAPPYFTILLVGHLTIPALFVVWQQQWMSDNALLAIAVPLVTVLTVALLRPVKGGTVGLMLKLGLMKTDQE